MLLVVQYSYEAFKSKARSSKQKHFTLLDIFILKQKFAKYPIIIP